MTATSHEIADGLEGVVAFATEIAEPDRDGGALRYRGYDVEELVGRLPFERVWGLLVDGTPDSALPVEEPYTLTRSTGDARKDLQAELVRLGARQLIDIDAGQARDDLARASALALTIVAQSASGRSRSADPGASAAERFLQRWRGEADPGQAQAIDAYWITAAEHGMNASTFTARVVASTGADAGAALSAAVGALSGPLHGGAPARVLPMLDAVAEMGDAEKWVEQALARKERIMGFGHRVYRAEDPRSRLLKRTAKELGSPRV